MTTPTNTTLEDKLANLCDDVGVVTFHESKWNLSELLRAAAALGADAAYEDAAVVVDALRETALPPVEFRTEVRWRNRGLSDAADAIRARRAATDGGDPRFDGGDPRFDCAQHGEGDGAACPICTDGEGA